MAIVQVALDVPDDIYREFLNGTIEIMGLAKDHNHRIRKHIPSIIQAGKDGTKTAIEVIKEHKGTAILVGGLLAIGIGATTTIAVLKQEKNKKQNKIIITALNNYIEKAKSGNISADVINELICVLNENNTDNININIDEKQLFDLVNCIYHYTLSLAKANNYNVKLSLPKKHENSIINLTEYLNAQKSIIDNAS
ncbi:MAG: hypothetical protein IJS03_08265 [Eubacterium sp.]|nr:hypothetical protein [Eubacterium sp.]